MGEESPDFAAILAKSLSENLIRSALRTYTITIAVGVARIGYLLTETSRYVTLPG